MAKHQRKLAGGALASTLVLPMLAQAAEGEMVAVGDLNGVAATEELADGGLQIIFEDGRVVQLGADHVQMMGEQVAVDAQALQSALEAAAIPVEQLEGVEGVVLNEDGTATITMEDGQRMLIEPGAMQVQSGQVVMTEAQVSGAGLGGNYSFSTPLEGAAMSSGASASTSSSSASGDTVLGGLTGAQLAMGAAGVGVVAALASSDSSSSSAPETPTEAPTEEPGEPNTVDAFVIDGYLDGATVTWDGGEATSINGLLQLPEGLDKELTVVGDENTIDISTGLPFDGTLKAPAGATVITPSQL
ncbi:hypothetical protein HLB35_14550 [Halomonas sp. TBZ9]|uniref:DUF5666 domain-containing protein n=1 Tax=Vreelandella azerica TaxID=2732867 RepID=A0A7Y3U1T2_9GAMM|nr:hypothetical protein [Halomonas azerica]NOG32674.1 hypothetical protein [Halomonas azerica]